MSDLDRIILELETNYLDPQTQKLVVEYLRQLRDGEIDEEEIYTDTLLD